MTTETGAWLGVARRQAYGWLLSAESSTPVVELLCRGVVVAASPCHYFSESLQAIGIGDGHHAFILPIPPDIEESQFANLQVRSRHSGKLLAQRIVAESLLQTDLCEGHIDSASHMMLRGWAWDPKRPDDPVSLDLLVDGQFEQHIYCADPRPDLQLHGKGNGRHGFHAPLPLRLLDNENHELRLRFSNTSQELAGSPFCLKGHSLLPSHIMTQGVSTLKQTVETMQALLHTTQQRTLLTTVSQSEEKQMEYLRWIREYDTITPTDRTRIQSRIQQMRTPPRISVVMPVYNTSEPFLRAAIDSVIGQLYPHWELCIADDASTEPYIQELLTEYAKKDARIKVTHRARNGHISDATNSALELATGDYIAFFDHDDMLREHALFVMAEAITRTDADILYSDEDKIDEQGVRFEPHFKPDWNYHYLLALNYICHLTVVRRSLIEREKGLQSAYNGAQDHDLLLRLLAHRPSIYHVPHILYH